MLNWIRRIIYIGDIGRWDARRNYPGEAHFIEIPLHGRASDGAGEASAKAEPEPKASPAEPANDPHDTPLEMEA